LKKSTANLITKIGSCIGVLGFFSLWILFFKIHPGVASGVSVTFLGIGLIFIYGLRALVETINAGKVNFWMACNPKTCSAELPGVTGSWFLAAGVKISRITAKTYIV